MPYSSPIFDDVIFEFIKLVKPSTVLDVGCGGGKYSDIVKSVDKNIHVTGVEVFEPYVDRFNLKERYDKLIVSNVIDLMSNDDTYDVVIFGDVIEHLPKSIGIDVINCFVYKSKWILVKYPVKFVQGESEGNKYERHQSHWDVVDFLPFLPDIIYYKKDIIDLVIIKGFLEKSDCIKEIRNTLKKYV